MSLTSVHSSTSKTRPQCIHPNLRPFYRVTCFTCRAYALHPMNTWVPSFTIPDLYTQDELLLSGKPHSLLAEDPDFHSQKLQLQKSSDGGLSLRLWRVAAYESRQYWSCWTNGLSQQKTASDIQISLEISMMADVRHGASIFQIRHVVMATNENQRQWNFKISGSTHRVTLFIIFLL